LLRKRLRNEANVAARYLTSGGRSGWRCPRLCEKASSGILPGGMSGGTRVKRFVEGQDRAQLMLLPECLDDFVGEDNPVRVVDAFIEELDLAVLGFAGVVP
jgi:hypothetical protein